MFNTSDVPHFPSLCLAVGEPDRSTMKVSEWQHTVYSTDSDSGIQSRATTVRDDDGDYTTSKQYTVTTTTVASEQPGKPTAIYYPLYHNYMRPVM